jgi:hypothetical protein
VTSLLFAILLSQEVTVKVVEKESGKPVFARVVLRDPAGSVVGSTGYRTLNGHFVPPEGWKVPLAKGTYKLRADAGFEFFAHEEDWTHDGAAEKRIELRRWVDFRKDGWFAGGDHNHLNRDGAKDKNYGGTQVTLEFAAALHASRGWAYYFSGGGGPWIVDGNAQPLHNGRRTEAAAAQWNAKYGAQLHLGWNNEILKTRYGHVWFVGACASGPTYPYTDKPGDAWWSFYDDSWDPWQTGDRSKPIGPYRSGLWDLPPTYDCIRSWRDRGLASIYAHPTRTFMIGKNRVSNIAVGLPFDLLAGAPVGGIAVMGDAPDHPQDQALWFAALNEGFRLAGVAENDTVYGSPDIRVGPHVTYTHVPDMGPAFDPAKLAAALAEGRNFMSSGAFCTIRAEGAVVEVRAWASADPADAIDVLEVVANGRTLARFAEASGKREFVGRVRASPAKWAIAKVVCRNKSAVAITNPVYFGDPPAPLTATVKGRATSAGSGVPAEIVVSAWGKEVARSKAAADGTYRLENVPLAARLTFAHGGVSAERVILFHDPAIAEIHARVWSTEFVGKPDSLAGVFPPDFFNVLRRMAKDVTLDAELSR